MQVNEVEGIAGMKENHEDTLEKAMDAYSDMLLRMACLMLGDFRLAEDATQDTFIRFYYSMGQFRGESSIKTYLSRILVNECRQKMRKHWFRKVLTFGALENTGQTDIHFTEEAHERMDLTQSLMRLDLKYREVLLLHYYNGLSVKEISYVLGQPEGTVKSKLKRGRENLKHWMEEGESGNDTLG